MTDYAKGDFYKHVAPHVKGVALPTVEDVVEDVIIDFCQRTSVYRQWLDDQIAVSQDDEEVSLTIPTDTAVVEVIAIQEVDSSGDYGDYIDPDTYQFSNQDGTAKILFNEPADEDYDARVRVALSPEVAFTVVPAWIWTDWRDVIVSGVCARLLSMRAHSWYSPNEAAFHHTNYMDGVFKASRTVVLETVNKINKPKSRYI